jgi:hypothetical protein
LKTTIFAISTLTIVVLLHQHGLSADQQANPSWSPGVDHWGNVLFHPPDNLGQASGESSRLDTPNTIAFVPGHYYTSNYFSLVITEYDSAGAVVGSYTVPSALGAEVRGLAFGADGLLYATLSRGGSGFAVLALRNTGEVVASYAGPVYTGGNLSFGKIAMDNQYLYVCGQDVLTRFTLGNPSSGTTIYTANQIYDVKPLPNGHLFVASAYYVDEITSSGGFVRRIQLTGGQSFTDIRGIEYNPATNILFVTHLGHTGFFFKIMRVDATTGALLNSADFTYADDLFLDLSGDLLVGSRVENPSFFSQNLAQQNSLNGGQQMFVTQYAPLTAQTIVSRKIHGSAGTFDINLPGVECRYGGATGDYSVVVTFPNTAFVTGSPQAQVNSGSATIGSGGVSNGGTVTINGNVVTIPLTNVANAQTVVVQINGVMSGPSRGNLPVSMGVLVGDVTGNNVVSAGDVALVKAQMAHAVDATNFRADVNADGAIEATDVTLVKSNSGSGF